MTHCPVLTPDERQAAELITKAEQAMLLEVMRAIGATTKKVEAGLKAIAFDQPAPSHDYFMAVTHRELFLKLCGADPQTGMGGDPVLAASILDSDRKFVALNWEEASHEDIQSTTANPENSSR